MRTLLVAAVAAVPFFAVAACGSSYNGSAPTGPTNAPPAGAVVIDIVGIKGDRSFSPNPSTASSGQMVVWHNVDGGNVHHIVLDDGRLDAGNVSPQSFTTAMVLATPGRYHCTIHPEMVGTIAGGQ